MQKVLQFQMGGTYISADAKSIFEMDEKISGPRFIDELTVPLIHSEENQNFPNEAFDYLRNLKGVCVVLHQGSHPYLLPAENFATRLKEVGYIEYVIAPVDYDQTKIMVESMLNTTNFSIEQSALKLVYEQAGGWPLLVQAAMTKPFYKAMDSGRRNILISDLMESSDVVGNLSLMLDGVLGSVSKEDMFVLKQDKTLKNKILQGLGLLNLEGKVNGEMLEYAISAYSPR